MAQFGYLEIILTTTILFLPFLWLWLWHCRRNEIPQAFTNWPLLGMLPGFVKGRTRFVEHITDALILSGGTLEFKGPCFCNFDFIVTSNPMNINHILSRKFDNYDKGPQFREIFVDTLGDGILNAASDSWKGQRKTLMSLMHGSKFVRRAEKTIRRKLEKNLLPMLEHFVKFDAEVDLQDIFQRFTYDNICMLVLGFDLNSLSIEFPQVPHQMALKQTGKVLTYRHTVPMSFWKLQRWLQIGEERKMSQAIKAADDFTYQCISSKREKLRTKTEVEEDELDLFTAFIIEQEGEISAFGKSDKFLKDFLNNILAAGTDTLTAGLSWFFWLVATNPSIETKILQEIKANSPNGTMFYGGENLKAFIYLHAVLCETLRLYPPVPMNHKAAIQSDILPSGHKIGNNTRIMLLFYTMGRMKEIWGEDCLEFKPERWISEQGDIIHVPSYHFTAFNAGPRTCIGKELSFFEMKMIAIAILSNYQIEVVKGCSPSPSNAIVLLMKDGLKVKVRKRAT